jgi:hypothetical protein
MMSVSEEIETTRLPIGQFKLFFCGDFSLPVSGFKSIIPEPEITERKYDNMKLNVTKEVQIQQFLILTIEKRLVPAPLCVPQERNFKLNVLTRLPVERLILEKDWWSKNREKPLLRVKIESGAYTKDEICVLYLFPQERKICISWMREGVAECTSIEELRQELSLHIRKYIKGVSIDEIVSKIIDMMKKYGECY